MTITIVCPMNDVIVSSCKINDWVKNVSSD